MVKRDDHFEVASLLRVRGGLRHRSVAGAAQDGFVADGSDFAGECFVRDGVNGDFRGLAVAHIRDVRLIYFNFGRYNTHIGEREQEAALRILNAWDDVFADANGNVADQTADRSEVSGLMKNVCGANERGLRLGEI